MGVLGLRGSVLRGKIGAAARREWAVSPRNSGVLGLGEGAARRFSARRTPAARLGEKFFKKGVENQKFGVLQRDKSCQSSKEVTLLHPITIRTFTGILEEIEKPTTLHRYPASHLRNS